MKLYKFPTPSSGGVLEDTKLNSLKNQIARLATYL